METGISPDAFAVPTFQDAAQRGFAWVSQELELPAGGQLDALRTAFLAHQDSGARALIRALSQAWPDGARWPSGEAWLQQREAAPESERQQFDDHCHDGLMGLLAHRLIHVSHRIYRDAQVRAGIHPDSPSRWRQYTHVCINRQHWHDGPHNACGVQKNSLISIPAGLLFLRNPAHKNPACDCTADPHPV